MDIDAVLAQVEAHEAAIRTKTMLADGDNNHDDDPTGLHKTLNTIFANVEQMRRLDAGRKRLVIKSYDT